MLYAIPQTLIDERCKQGKGREQCRYLAVKPNGKFTCCKLEPNINKMIEAETESLMKRYADSGKKDYTLATGDNCPGVRF
jgi:hypothetical protein